jgi:hypothetical protein
MQSGNLWEDFNTVAKNASIAPRSSTVVHSISNWRCFSATEMHSLFRGEFAFQFTTFCYDLAWQG